MTRFRLKDFKVYGSSKVFCKLCRDILETQIRPRDRELSSQIARALISIVLNIGEGSSDHSDVEFSRFLGISMRSVYEVVAAFDIAFLYEYIAAEQNEKIESAAHDLVKQLAAFRNSLHKDKDQVRGQ